MPRRLSLYNGENDEIEASVIPVEKTDGVTAANRNRKQSLDKVTSSMTTNEKAETRIAAMAVEFDHMYLGCSETKASIGKDIEVQHLKDLLLLHLDLIQQQAEQLVAKDKIIKSLRDENDHLRSRLDRIDRRVSLSLNKKTSESTGVELKQEIVSEEDQLDSQKSLGSPSAKPDSQANKVLSPSNKNASSSKLPCPSNKVSSPCSKPVSPASKSLSPASSKVGSPTNKSLSPSSKSPSIKSLSPSSKIGSPLSKPGSPLSKPGSPLSKPGSPLSKPGSPLSKPGSPLSKPGSPLSKPGSPLSKPGSPLSKPGSPLSKPGSPLSKPGSPSKPVSPQSKPGSPLHKSSPITNKPLSPVSKLDSPLNKSLSPANKLQSPNNKVGLLKKSLSPQLKVVSPSGKALSLNNKVSPSLNNKAKTSPPSAKPSSPQPKTATSLSEEVESPLGNLVDDPNHVESSTPRSGPSRLNRKSYSRPVAQKALLREKRQRNTSQSQSSENDTEIEPLKDVAKSVNDKERPRLKRRSESETETSPIKRIRSERERSSHGKDDGLTDHNLRSRDKSRDSLKSTSKDDLPPSPAARAPTPTPRAAALEAKKLRQKLQLKGKTPGAVTVRGEGILNTTVTYFLPYGNYIHDPNPEEECLQAQVEIPRWGTRILTSLYVMEGTENLEDEIFIKRHAKPEQDEKRRKRWDLQRMREQRHYERLRERYESRQTANEPTVSGSGSLWPCPESAVYLHVEDTLPVCAFGQPLARIPPQEFTIPWLTGHGLEGVSTRRRKR
ncbi:male-specific lethal 1 homolog isoform X2 [Palaemon carinicauda]|uniref:male-specific lethal 1 homolog isoform X2 n=1 Tax=Palaemon carinicauda TaxID=392227 RepID=UPI0035B64615